MKKITTLFTLLLLILSAQLVAQSTGDFYDVTSIHDLKITFSQKNWANSLDSNRLNGDDMLVGTVSIDGSTYENCGISYVKSPSYQTASLHNPWLIRLNLIDKKQAHQGYKTLMISQALRDPSLVREVLGYEIMRKYIPAQRANYINMTVNSVNKGVYVNVEAIDEPFLQRNFSYTEGSLFRCVPDVRATPLPDCNGTNFGALRYEANAKCYLRNFDMLSKDGWDDLIELTRMLQQDPERIGAVLNLDRTLWFLALQNVLVNLNSYEGQFSGNYYLYRDVRGQFNFMPTEMNLIFGSFKNVNGSSDLDFDGLVTLDPMIQIDNPMKPLIAQILKNQDNRKVYMAHIRQILADWFENDAYKTRAEALQKLIVKSYDATAEKPYELADFQRSLLETVGKVTKIPGIVELMSKRAKFLKKYPDLLNVPPKVSDINFSNRQKFVAKTVSEFHIKAKIDNFPRRVRLFYRPVGTTVAFTELQMFDDGKSHDAEAGDKIFGIAINPRGNFDAIEYYILAESAGGATFEPATYYNQLRKISLTELNK
jgi:spore coat protein CotH